MTDSTAPWRCRTSGPWLLLMGGGLDSSALAWALRPVAGLVVDYGQSPAAGEIRAAKSVGAEIGVEVHTLTVDLAAVGSGLLATGARGLAAIQRGEVDETSPSPEWWPYRNQLLVTLAAAWGYGRGFAEVVTGTVAADAARHADGTAVFYNHLDALLAAQEGAMRVSAPVSHLDTGELLDISGVPRRVLGWTHSCHVSAYACGRCPGCFKAETTLAARL